MKGSKIARALTERIKGAQETKRVARDPEAFKIPGSKNPRKGYSGEGKPERHKHKPQGANNPSRHMRKANTKSEDRARIRGLTKGARRLAQKSVRRSERIDDGG